MDNLTTSVYTLEDYTLEDYTLEEHFVLLIDGEDGWALDVYYVDAQDEHSEVAVNLRNLEDPHALLEFSIPVGQMSQANCASLVDLAKSGTLKFYLNVIWNTRRTA